MPKSDSAVALLSDVDKSEYNEKNFYQIAPAMFAKINEKIDGRHGNALKLIYYLIFQLQNNSDFRPAEETICQNCNFIHSSYVEARKYLISLGFITHIPFQSITIHYKKIME